MNIVGEVSEDGVTERRFELVVGGERVPGIVWLPTGARGPRPLLLQGHGGIQHKRVQNILDMARRMVRNHGYAVAAIDAPGHGDRITPEAAERMRERVAASMQRGAAGGGQRRPGMSDEQRQGMMKSAQMAVTEWKATLDALQRYDEIGAGGPVGYWGVSMGTRFGVPFIASDPRIKCAVLGLFGIGPDKDEFSEQATSIKVPLLFLFQLNDELMNPTSGLALFTAFGSETKTMHVNPGPHVGIPLFERDSAEAFFVRHMGSARS